MESKKIVSGIKWAGIQVILDTFLRFSVRLILAKLLLPQEFGLVAMCTVFIAVAEATSELGMGAALIQRKSNEESAALYNTAFWSGIVWGLIVFLIMAFIVGPFAAYFYEQPRLVQIVPLLSLGILVKPLGLIHVVKLTRAMDFKKIAKSYNISALIAGAAGIVLAYYDFGVWALIVHQVLSSILPIPLLYLSTKWKPVMEWNRQHFNEIFGFGAYSTGTSVFSTLTYNIDNLLIGKILGASLLGSYALSFSLTENLRQIISNVLNRVMYPVFSQSQDDMQKLRNYFLKIININALIIYPMMTALILFGDEIIIGFFGQRWLNSIMPLKILAFAMMVHLLVNSFTSLLRGIGKPKLEMKIIMGLTIFVLLPCLYIGITYYGLIGAAIAILINKIALVAIGLIVLKREINLSVITVLSAIKNIILAICISALIVVLSRNYLGFENNIILFVIYILVYLGFVFKLEKQNLLELTKKIS